MQFKSSPEGSYAGAVGSSEVPDGARITRPSPKQSSTLCVSRGCRLLYIRTLNLFLLSQTMTMMISYSSLSRAPSFAGFGFDGLTQDRGMLQDRWSTLSHCVESAFDEKGTS